MGDNKQLEWAFLTLNIWQWIISMNNWCYLNKEKGSSTLNSVQQFSHNKYLFIVNELLINPTTCFSTVYFSFFL